MTILKKILLLLSDLALFYITLALTLIIRYSPENFAERFKDHFLPFSIIMPIWLLIFYLSDLYRFKSFPKKIIFLRKISLTIFISGIITIVAFYLFGDFFKLTPKTNLLIFAAIFLILNASWRLLLAKLFARNALKTIILGSSPLIDEIIAYLKENPEIGYQVVKHIEENKNFDFEKLAKEVISNDVQLIIIQPALTKKFSTLNAIYRLLPLEISIMNAINFYEILFNKTPITELNEEWFITNITVRRPIYDFAKRFTDLIIASVIGIIFILPSLLIAFLIRITSTGSAIYKQERIGKNSESFTLFKFRTMHNDINGALWTEINDRRITTIGKFLRTTHLDEIPQLINVVKNDISFIGPRAERKELVEKYQQFAYYDIRHLIKPGITGWAQINFRPSASMEEAYEKLHYDVFYLKNRSLFLDILIMLKTIRHLFGLNNN
ncbi:MAG: exopolysaccharide biosynthesis polyprenyl glycosylphosphotransferase [bacterium]|nr:exopolysaccharide biosynthesis polyprenyl glycosylphosphotransferase [bacterium]